MFRSPLRRCFRLRAALAAAAFLAAGAAAAGEARVAVAANFTRAAVEIGRVFATSTGHEAVFSFGSTGQLYTQITQGAPFDVFLAADQVRPARAVDAGHAVPGSRLTYATGRIVLFSRDDSLVRGNETLRQEHFTRLAIANPAVAPYGAAAVEVLAALGAYDSLAAKIVRGTNIAQTYQFVETGNAELGFVALAQVVTHDKGSRWIVPQALHSPISQDAVLLIRGSANPAAKAFVDFLRGERARAIINKYGYGPGE